MEEQNEKIDENIRRLHMFRALTHMRKFIKKEQQQDRQNRIQIIIILLILGTILLGILLYILPVYIQQSPAIIAPDAQQTVSPLPEN